MIRLVIAMTIVCLVTTTSHAHPGFNEVEAPAGEYHLAELRVTHGCGGSPTHTVKVDIPNGVMSVKPRIVPGWNVKVTTRKLVKPIIHHGVEVNEIVEAVTWSGGSLPDNVFELFELRFMTPQKPGTRIDFPLTQICDDGEILWHEIAEPGEDPMDLDRRAPYILLVGKSDH